jgi:hypothetical protein
MDQINNNCVVHNLLPPLRVILVGVGADGDVLTPAQKDQWVNLTAAAAARSVGRLLELGVHGDFVRQCSPLGWHYYTDQLALLGGAAPMAEIGGAAPAAEIGGAAPAAEIGGAAPAAEIGGAAPVVAVPHLADDMRWAE